MSSVSMKENHLLDQAVRHWRYVAPVLTYPKNELDYDKLVKRLDQLLDIVGDNEKHPLMGLIDALSNIISDYEDSKFQSIKGSGADALKYFMELHKLKQSDLPEIGSQGVVSEILHGKRELNLRQIKLLAQRFNVEIETFIDSDEE